MKVYALDIKEQDFKPHKVLDWLDIEYHKIFILFSLSNCSNFE